MKAPKLFLFLGLALAPAAARAANVVCGQTIDGDSVVLDGNVGPCPGIAITLTNGATLDLNAHQVTCNGGPATVGVVVKNGSQLKNGRVSACTFSGVEIDGSAGNTVQHITSTKNGYGFTVYASGISTLKFNVALANTSDGFFATSAPHKLVSNTAVSNGGAGFYASAGAQLRYNHAVENTGSGFRLGSDTRLKANFASANTQYGFDFVGQNNQLNGCVAIANSWGFVVDGDNNQIKKSLGNANSGAGIETSAANTVVSASVFDANGTSNGPYEGMLIAPGTATSTFKKNQAWGNHSIDIDVIDVTCGTNTFSGNQGFANAPCVQ